MGSYSDPWNVGDIEVTWDGTQLGVSMPDLDAWHTYDPVLIPYTTDNYLFNVTGSSMLITFMRDDAGMVSHFEPVFCWRTGRGSSEGKSAGEEETGQSSPVGRPFPIGRYAGLVASGSNQ